MDVEILMGKCYLECMGRGYSVGFLVLVGEFVFNILCGGYLVSYLVGV